MGDEVQVVTIHYMLMLERNPINDEVRDSLGSMVMTSDVKDALRKNQMEVLLIVA